MGGSIFDFIDESEGALSNSGHYLIVLTDDLALYHKYNIV